MKTITISCIISAYSLYLSTSTPTTNYTTFVITDSYPYGDVGCKGQYFDLMAINDINIDSVAWTFNGCINAVHGYKLYVKDGSYQGFESDSSAWTLACDGLTPCEYDYDINQWRANTQSCIINMERGETKGFYLTGIERGMICSWVRDGSVAEGDLWSLSLLF